MQERNDMDTPWLQTVKSTHQLSVFAGQSLSGSWPKVFSDALTEFNKLSNANGLGVTLTRASTPPTRSLTGANIQFEATNGTLNFESFAGPVSVPIAGTGTSGKTKSIGSPSNGGRLAQSFICVPLTPQVFAPGGVLREAGDPIKLVIAVHELLHACGLDRHTSFKDPDLFIEVLSDVADADPNKDLEDIGSGKKIPPLFLSAETVARLQFL
jgi:hypothetical protein